MTNTFIHAITAQHLPGHSGGKAEQLHHLMKMGVPVPRTFVCVWDAFEQATLGETAVLVQLQQELARITTGEQRYAVRSSANVEDNPRFSFAGQFASLLDVTGGDSLLAAVQQVWQSATTGDLDAYTNLASVAKEQLRMAVLIQEMVPPVISGVAFSKNPMTGLNEIVVEAVAGSGESLVQGGQTPDRWVHKWGDWVQRPAHTEIDEAVVAEVVAQTAVIAAKHGAPVDLEWVYDGTAVFWVQLRDITTLTDINIYSNRLSRELLPGLIKPLVWSVNIPMINSAWLDLISEVLGPQGVAPEALSKAFYYQAYFNMEAMGRFFTAMGLQRDTLEVMMGLEGGDQRPKFRPSSRVLRHLPRMVGFSAHKLRYGRELDKFLPEMDRVYASFAAKPVETMSAAALMAEIEALIAFTGRAAYANIVGPLLMQFYNGRLRAALQRHGVAYEQLKMPAFRQATADFDPNPHLDRLHDLFRQLEPAVQAQIAAGSFEDFMAMAGVSALQTAVSQFLAQFGHLSDSGNDFSKRPWRETPDLVLTMIRSHKHVPHDHLMTKHKDSDPQHEIYTWETLPISRVTRRRLGWLYRRALAFRTYREAISFKYTYGYGLLRRYFLALAGHLVMEGVVQRPDDIFYLYWPEVKTAVTGSKPTDYPAIVHARRQEMTAAADIILPEIIYGDSPPPLETYDDSQMRLKGVATSGGYFQGPVRVIQSVRDFHKMIPGAVLVVPFSDVSWTPLFANAGAVIAESGGILSHSSIVARERRIPAVVSVNGACRLLKDDMPVIVNGFSGEVILTGHD